jgi:serine protease Do
VSISRLLSSVVLCLTLLAGAGLEGMGPPGGELVSLAARARGKTAISDLYLETAPAVVAITCQKGNDSYHGTGMIIDPSGLILTSVTVLPPGARKVAVYFRGGRVESASLVFAEPEKEVSLARLDAAGVRRLLGPGETALPYLRLGDSSEVRVGDFACSLGNAFQCIENDDQVSLAAGLVSGLFELTEKRPEATYIGPSIETSAALNNFMDGGPLVNRKGEVIGVLSVNYSRNRWLGTAIPINEIKPILAAHRGWFDDRHLGLPAYAGLELEEVAGREIRVLRLREGGPAARSGMLAGDIVKSFDGKRLASLAEFRRLFGAAPRGAVIELGLEREGEPFTVEVVLWGSF